VNIYCGACMKDVDARLTDGKEIYPHRPDLFDLPFWICRGCRNYVGCHHKTVERTKPLGAIVPASVRKLRVSIHALIDPLWKGGKHSRGAVYAAMAKQLGYVYHTAEIVTEAQALQVYETAKTVASTLLAKNPRQKELQSKT